MKSAEDIIRLLDLRPHPEGGHYRETWRSPAPAGERAAGTAIYYLLKAGEFSRWHRVDADEIWHWHGGGALAIDMSAGSDRIVTHVLGGDLSAGERPQIVVPKMVWQMAKPMGAWTLVTCTVSPGFEFAGFEMAPEGWAPDLSKL